MAKRKHLLSIEKTGKSDKPLSIFSQQNDLKTLVVEDDFLAQYLLPYGLICLDIMMPVMNGHEALPYNS